MELHKMKEMGINSKKGYVASVVESSTDEQVQSTIIKIQAKGKDLELKGHSDSVYHLCWDPKHADLLATASGDKTVRLWDARRPDLSSSAIEMLKRVDTEVPIYIEPLSVQCLLFCKYRAWDGIVSIEVWHRIY